MLLPLVNGYSVTGTMNVMIAVFLLLSFFLKLVVESGIKDEVFF